MSDLVIPNNVRELLAKTKGALKGARADGGFGWLGEWPTTPGHSGFFRAVLETPTFNWEDKIKFYRTKGSKTEEAAPAYSVQFNYNVLEQITEDGVILANTKLPMKVKGNKLTIPYNPDGLPDGSGGTNNIQFVYNVKNAGILKQALQVILDVEEVEDDIAALSALMSRFEKDKTSGGVTVAKVYLQHTSRDYTRKDGTAAKAEERQDYIRELLAK